MNVVFNKPVPISWVCNDFSIKYVSVFTVEIVHLVDGRYSKHLYVGRKW